MSLLLAVSDFSTGEGVYPAEVIARLAPRLGYTHVAAWDWGLHGWPRLRGEALAAGLTPLLGCRFRWREMSCGALPHSDLGYGELCRLLTDLAHGRPGQPPRECALLAETLEGLEALAREGFPATLLGHGRNQREAAAALARGLPVAAPQVLRFRRQAGLELHRLKRALAACATITRTEPLWDPRDAAVPRPEWEARFPWAEPRVARATEALAEQAGGWRMHWGDWVMPRPLCPAELDLDAELRARVRAGLPRRYPRVGPEHRARIELELELIRGKRFAGYFLAVHDLIREAGATRTCGRGSGAASIVSYLLGITNVDPIAANLMFERFLSEARLDPPDLDIDFAYDERDTVIASVFARYGRERVAMVSNHVYFQPRGALRDVAMAFGRPEAELKTLARLQRGWDEGLQGIQDNPAWAPVLAQAQALAGHFHQLSVHPGGTVIAPGPLWHHVPTQPAPAKEGVSITAWDKDGVEDYGLVKIDLLGNRSLAVVRDALEELGDRSPERPGKPPAAGLWQPRLDPATQDLLARGDSMGVFYVESPATRQLQQRVGKGDFETLVIHSSLIRPAAHHWIDTYVKRSRGEEIYVPSHPALGALLSESYGVLVYQEDVVRVGMALAGWSHPEADQLRKLLGKHDCARKLPLFEARFREGCLDQGIPEPVIEEVWDMVRTFRGYSFCKPHSASYAQVSFESAWLKAHHPAVFFAAVITHQGGYYPAIAYLGDARRHRLVVRGPDVNASRWAFAAEGEQGLRVGLMAVKGARQEEVLGLLEERERHGPYRDLQDLLRRAPLSVPTAEALGSGGAFDLWAPDGDRTRLLWARLGGIPPGVRPRPTDPFDRAALEMELLGLTLELHPAALQRARHGGAPSRAEAVREPGRHLRFWALVVAEKTVRTERGELMQFLTFEDETALCEAVAFPDAYRRRRRPLRVGDVLPVAGRSTRQDGLAVLEVA
jgi:DNA-directed DNA polymerase III PolC